MLGGTLREGRRAAGVHFRFLSSIVFVIGFSSAAWGQVAVIGGPSGSPLALPTVTTHDDLKFGSGLQLAQVGTIGGPGGPSLSAPPVATGRPSEFATPGRERTALAIDDWQIYPTAFGGFFYDSNPVQSPTATSSFGVRAVPSFLAERADGIHKTSLKFHTLTVSATETFSFGPRNNIRCCLKSSQSSVTLSSTNSRNRMTCFRIKHK